MEYSAYLDFLTELHEKLNTLIQAGQEKMEAIQTHDLDALNASIRKEQALSLSLRGLEQKRQHILSQLGLEDVPLREMPDRCPPANRAETARLVEQVLRDVRIMESIHTPVREILEQGLKMIQGELEARGIPQDTGEDYQTVRPAETRTDIRA